MSAPRLCEDWQCPAKWSCAKALCRSREYWAMSERPIELFKGDRRRHQDACAEYERDKPRAWLKDAFTARGEAMRPEIPEDYKGLKLVQ